MDEGSTVTCHKGDAFTGENPLVKQRLVPESLAKIMFPLPELTRASTLALPLS